MATKQESAALAEHWRQHVDTWKASGLPRSEFCKTNTLSYHRFCYWERKLHSNTPSVKGGGFATVSRSPTPPDCGLSIALPGGLVVQGITAGNLRLVCQLLSDLT